jgi:hypothetical protein
VDPTAGLGAGADAVLGEDAFERLFGAAFCGFRARLFFTAGRAFAAKRRTQRFACARLGLFGSGRTAVFSARREIFSRRT